MIGITFYYSNFDKDDIEEIDGSVMMVVMMMLL
jgi:hypothetical protein